MNLSRRAWWRRVLLAGRGRIGRRLAGIEGALESEAKLATMFATFNAVTRGEPAMGPEPLPRPGWRPGLTLTGPWVSHVAVLLAMVAAMVGALLLSSATRPVMRSCLSLTANATPSAAQAGTSGHGSRCPAYPTSK